MNATVTMPLYELDALRESERLLDEYKKAYINFLIISAPRDVDTGDNITRKEIYNYIKENKPR